MSGIYRISHHVLIWTGLQSVGQGKKLSLVDQEVDAPTIQGKFPRRFADYLSKATGGQENGIAVTIPKSDLSQLFKAAYWERMWIVQEILLAPIVIVFLGSENYHMLDLEPPERDVSAFYDLAKHRKSTLMPRSSPGLLGLLDSYMLQKCHDRRDRVFSLLGLCEHGYSRSTIGRT